MQLPHFSFGGIMFHIKYQPRYHWICFGITKPTLALISYNKAEQPRIFSCGGISIYHCI
uniref:Uncharacterized protein n=1 Tax=Rhizophora mucronata TaxID=61149 RepID=A0A2P2PKV5_RHIMU